MTSTRMNPLRCLQLHQKQPYPPPVHPFASNTTYTGAMRTVPSYQVLPYCWLTASARPSRLAPIGTYFSITLELNFIMAAILTSAQFPPMNSLVALVSSTGCNIEFLMSLTSLVLTHPCQLRRPPGCLSKCTPILYTCGTRTARSSHRISLQHLQHLSLIHI